MEKCLRLIGLAIARLGRASTRVAERHCLLLPQAVAAVTVCAFSLVGRSAIGSVILPSRAIDSHKIVVQALAVSDGGHYAAWGDNRGVLHVAQVAQRRVIATWSSPSPVTDIRFVDHDRKLLTLGDGDRLVHIWDVHTGERIQTIAVEGDSPRLARPAVSADGVVVALAPDGLRPDSPERSGGPVTILNTATGEAFTVPVRIDALGGGPALSANGHFLVAPNRKASLIVWDLAANEPALAEGIDGAGVRAAAFTPDSRWLIVGREGGVIELRRAPRFSLARRISLHEIGGDWMDPRGIWITPDGGGAVVLSAGGAVGFNLVTINMVDFFAGRVWESSLHGTDLGGAHCAVSIVDDGAAVRLIVLAREDDPSFGTVTCWRLGHDRTISNRWMSRWGFSAFAVSRVEPHDLVLASDAGGIIWVPGPADQLPKGLIGRSLPVPPHLYRPW